MPRRAGRRRDPAPLGKGIQQYVRLENRLVLLAWINSLLGYKSNRELLEDIRNIPEGFAADGHSFIYHHLIARGAQVKIDPEDLARYDENIRMHLESINRRRTKPITLRYFQYLAALYTEIFLDHWSKAPVRLLADLNNFVQERGSMLGVPGGEQFTKDDLAKVAYWMATGSGKTLLMHLNYYQFLHYNTKPLDNILLITPNEGLSEQHLKELNASGISARRFDLNRSGIWTTDRNVVDVIEITKLVEEKRGGGVTVPVEAFEGYNLIFVDEGHKGSSGDAWRTYRDKLGQTGFTFEYSATFGQALTAADNESLISEYSKSIIFDYSYRYFYNDGYGKDFRILNIKEDYKDLTEMLLMGNLLSFYEQLRLFEDKSEVLRPYNLEKPLWIFVGGTVNAVYRESRRPRSDVLTVIRFLHHVLQDRSWAVETIMTVLDGTTGLTTPDGRDVFDDRFEYLHDIEITPEDLYEQILRDVFHVSASGGLHVCNIRSSPGELGLKAAGANDYFGLIYIGDTSDFIKLVEEAQTGITLEEDAISHSQFDSINQPNSRINILIGAKKFIEGWNSWRVASMGLLNIGRSEGSQIIQLFGRGIRLKGKEMSLKRSKALAGDHPKHLHLLETLNIFSVRADYMAEFREYLEKEGVEIEPPRKICLPVRLNEPFLQKGLVVPRPPDNCDFMTEKFLLLQPEQGISIHLDMSARVQMIDISTGEGLIATEARFNREQTIPQKSLEMVDWQQVYLDLLAYKERKGLTNLVIRPEVLQEIIKNVSYTIRAEEKVFWPGNFDDRYLVQEAVTQVLCKYVDKFYRKNREQWESQTMVYRPLDKTDPNLAFNCDLLCEEACPSYTIEIPCSDERLIEEIQRLIENAEQLYNAENNNIPRIRFDRHLYLPLLVEKDLLAKIKVSPPALKPSEAQFVRDLRDYWNSEKDRSLAGKEVYLLRNLSRGHGVGFFGDRGFYPDFILWVVDADSQRIVFLEPHGMVYARAYEQDDKARLHEKLPELARKIGERCGRDEVSLDSFIISSTPYDELAPRYADGTWSRADFAEKHILFQERVDDYDYIALIFAKDEQK